MKITPAREKKKRWSMSAITLAELDTKPSASQRWILISCDSIRIITVGRAMDGMESVTPVK